MIIDTHSHLHFEDFENIENEINTMKVLWVVKSVLIWSDFSSTEKALELARKYSIFKVVAWISHPTESPLIENLEEEIKKVETQIQENKEFIVGIWEVGLDYFHLNTEQIEKEKTIQKNTFLVNINLAKKYNLPLIIHVRDAWDDAFEIIKNSQFSWNIVIHCFTGNPEIVDKFLSLWESIYIWFSWIVTFKNALDVQNSITKVPLDRILVETDAPYLAPAPHRGKLNTSWYTKFVLDKIKELRDENPEIIENQIYENSLRFYWIN